MGSKITVDSDCRQKLKDVCSLKKSYDKLGILKSRDITLSTKVQIVKAMAFPVVMYRCDVRVGP